MNAKYLWNNTFTELNLQFLTNDIFYGIKDVPFAGRSDYDRDYDRGEYVDDYSRENTGDYNGVRPNTSNQVCIIYLTSFTYSMLLKDEN